MSISIKVPALAGLLLGAATGSAMAQNVTISGYLDIGAYRDFDKVKKVGSIQRSSITFSGNEDLGQGMKAIFRLEHRFEPDTGTLELAGKPFWHGEATVGLKGSFGTIRLGRALTAMWGQDWQFDPWYNFNRIASPSWQFWHYLTPTDRTSNGGGPEYGRLNNGIFYDSPDFGGLSFHLSGTPEKTTAPGEGRNRGGSVVYNAGNWGAILATERNGSGDDVVFLAGKATFGSLLVTAAIDQSKLGDADVKAKVFTLAGAYTIGAGAIKAGFGKLDIPGGDARFYSLGGEYNLSKRTQLYVSLGSKRPDNAPSQNAFGAGVAHAF